MFRRGNYHRGATGELPVYILTSKYLVEVIRKEEEGQISQRERSWYRVNDKSISRIAKLSKDCLAEFEAGYKLVTPIIEPDTIFDADGVPIELMYRLRHKNKPIPTVESIERGRSQGFDAEKDEYNTLITLNNCVMVVMADDLNHWLSIKPQDEVIGDAIAECQASAKPASTKVVQVKSNNTEFSGLLNIPEKKMTGFRLLMT